MTIRRPWAALLLGIGFATRLWSQGPAPEAIPDGYDFPKPERVLKMWLELGNQPRLRWHAWRVFEGMTGSSASGEPRWATWQSKQEVFRPSPEPHLLSANGETPMQLQPELGLRINSIALDPTLSSEEKARRIRLTLTQVTVLFDPEAARTIQNPTNNSPPVRLWCRDDLIALNGRFNQAGTPLEKRTIPDFEPRAIAVKAIWGFVGPGVTEIPVWDAPPANLVLPQGNPKETFKRTVKIDTSPATCGQPGLVCLNRFYEIPFLINAALKQLDPTGLAVQPGYHKILLGLHFTTKEMKDWVWATLWWHDSPDRGPYAKNRPASLQAPWTNYLMDVSYDMVQPEAGPGQPHAAFNPYLEAAKPGGTSSNCMTCHRRAAIGLEATENDVYRGKILPSDSMFANTTKTDFLWSLANNQLCGNQ